MRERILVTYANAIAEASASYSSYESHLTKPVAFLITRNMEHKARVSLERGHYERRL